MHVTHCWKENVVKKMLTYKQTYIRHSGGSRSGRILGVWECFDALSQSHISYVFGVIVEDKIDIENTACWLQWKYICMICHQNLQKLNKKISGTRGRAPGVPVLDPPLRHNIMTSKSKGFFLLWFFLVQIWKMYNKSSFSYGVATKVFTDEFGGTDDKVTIQLPAFLCRALIKQNWSQ